MIFMVLATILIVVTITNGILSFILSHFQHTFHQVRRIQAYYSALSGIHLATEQLRTGAWSAPNTYKICGFGIDCTGNPDCTTPNFCDGDLAYNVSIAITGTPSSNTINATVAYSSAP